MDSKPILIFGGTTEGRRAVSVVQEAGKRYFYSTLTPLQEIVCDNGVRLVGNMDEDDMRQFCTDNDVGLIIDAAHPFASTLHSTIGIVSQSLDIPVIRFERIFPKRSEEIVWCRDYSDAVQKMEAASVKRLLALTGVKTISRLKEFWKNHDCFFRILDRTDSIQMAIDEGFDQEKLVYYEEDNLPYLLSRIGPDTIITKESGISGQFEEKVKSANALGIKIFAVMRPPRPSSFVTVTGEFGLRKEIERLLPGFFELRSGFTTGACATAAAKAALTALVEGEIPNSVTFSVPDGEIFSMPISSCSTNGKISKASVIKDAGDDPDVTNGIEICAEVKLSDNEGITIYGGEGVGIVTLPGLGLEIGEAAINKTPREMIQRELSTIYSGGIEVIVSVPMGREIAKRTFNPRIGIEGGISIIGTSGIVQPFSHDAFIGSVRRCLEVAKASGAERVVINSGAKSEEHIKKLYSNLPSQAFVHYGNAVGETLKLADSMGIPKLTLGMMIGKAVKFASGAEDTHSKTVTMDKTFLANLAHTHGCSDEAIKTLENINLARQIWDELPSKDSEKLVNAILSRCKENAQKLYSGDLEVLMIRDI